MSCAGIDCPLRHLQCCRCISTPDTGSPIPPRSLRGSPCGPSPETLLPRSTPSSARWRPLTGPAVRGRRRGHRQDPRHHAPHRLRRRHRHVRARAVLAVTFTTRAAGEMRSRLAALGAAGRAGAHVPLRGAAAGALLLAQGLRRRAARAVGVEAAVPRRGGAPVPGRHRQALLRDLAGEIEWAKVSNVGPDDYPRLAPAAAGVVAGLDAADGRPRVRRVRGGQARAGPLRHGGPAAGRRRAARRRRAGGRPGAPAVPLVHRRRVPGRQPGAGGAADPVARRPRRPVRRRRPVADHLHLRRCVDDAPGRVRPALPGARSASSWCATTGRPRRWSRWPTRVASRTDGPRGRGPAAQQRPDGPSRHHRAARRGGRGGVAGRRAAAAAAGRRGAARHGRAGPHQRPDPGAGGGVRRARPGLTSCVAPSASSTGPRCARRSRCCAAPPRGGERRRRPGPGRSRRCWRP